MNYNRIRRTLCVLAIAAAAVACGSTRDTGGEGGGENVGQVEQRLTAAPTLNTFINSSLEIDQTSPGSLQPQDANLFTGNDPADGTASNQAPGGGPASWIDWNDLGADAANHRLLDTDLASGKDPTAFPQSNECVGPAQVLSKMDLRYVAAANNNKYAYFGVLRSNNNGDAGYYWLFTKKSPKLNAGEAPCNAQQQRLLYDIGAGDVLLAGHFHPNGAPLLRVFTAKSAQSNVTAVNAVDYTSSLWAEVNSAVAAVAVNTTVTAPGALGHDGVVAMSGQNLDTEVFAEAAVNLAVFTGQANQCGATYYGSVITRSSGAGGTSPDLKDLAGPALFNFGSVTAAATLTGGCSNSLAYSASGLGMDGQPLQNPTCAWVFDNGAAASAACSGVLSVSAGTHSAVVTVSDGNTACQATASATGAQVFSPLGISLSLQAAAQSCPSMSSDAVTYAANVTGGTGQNSIAWSGASCSGASCTVDPLDSNFCSSGTLQATVSDTSGVCPPANSEVETFSKVTIVTASDN